MSLHFFSDQCVPAEIIEFLRQHDYRVTKLQDVIPKNSPDPKVIEKSREIGAILLSLNGDFADIVAYPPQNYSGIVAIQLHNHPEVIPQLMRFLIQFLGTNPLQDYYKGKLFIVEPHRIRIR
jgi:predicted nuclease of predicted toxin-antitoxin system